MAEFREVKRSEILDTDDEIIEWINYGLEYNMVDNGIGSYEFWGSKEVDVRIEPELTKEKGVRILQTANDECILTEVSGRFITDDEDNNHEVDWNACMTSCQIETVKVKNEEDTDKFDYVCVYSCEFEVEEGH